MNIKAWLLDKGLKWVLESKTSPIGWLDGWKTTIGNVLTVLSGLVLLLQQQLCPGWEYCGYLDQASVLIAFLLSLLVKLVGEWHAKDKELRDVVEQVSALPGVQWEQNK